MLYIVKFHRINHSVNLIDSYMYPKMEKFHKDQEHSFKGTQIQI